MFAQFIQAAPAPGRASRLLRQLHRWVSVLFVICVISTTIALAQPKPIMWMSYLPLGPLAILTISGAWLFIRPYLGRRAS